MMTWFKSLFCRHEYQHQMNLYGDEINHTGGKRSVWKCRKCGARQYRTYLHHRCAMKYGEEMSIKTIYTCDRCNTDVQKNEIFKVKLLVGRGYAGAQQLERDWCEKCLAETNISNMHVKTRKRILKTETLPEPPTFESLVRELVQQELENHE